MHLSNDELKVLYDVASDRVMYGDDLWVYGDADEAKALRSAVSALRAEARARGFWWAK